MFSSFIFLGGPNPDSEEQISVGQTILDYLGADAYVRDPAAGPSHVNSSLHWSLVD